MLLKSFNNFSFCCSTIIVSYIMCRRAHPDGLIPSFLISWTQSTMPLKSFSMFTFCSLDILFFSFGILEKSERQKTDIRRDSNDFGTAFWLSQNYNNHALNAIEYYCQHDSWLKHSHTFSNNVTSISVYIPLYFL